MVLVFVGYIWWSAPSKEEREKAQAYQDSLYQVYTDSVARAEEMRIASQLLADSLAAGDTAAQQKAIEKIRKAAGAFACNIGGENTSISVENEVLSLDINTLGASSRGAERIVYSSDGLIYYTDDHYESFTQLY